MSCIAKSLLVFLTRSAYKFRQIPVELIASLPRTRRRRKHLSAQNIVLFIWHLHALDGVHSPSFPAMFPAASWQAQSYVRVSITNPTSLRCSVAASSALEIFRCRGWP